MSDYVEVENLPKANELINDDYVLINQNEDDAKVDMGTIKDFVRPPNASTTESGLVTTTAQSFSGKKSFTETSANKSTIDNLISNKATLGDATVNDLHITGNLIQDGEVIETEVETLKVKDQVIVTRSGATTGMTDGEVTGIVAEKYDGQNNGVLVFGSDGIARVGDEGDAQPLATREETPNNGSLQVWDEKTQSLKSFPFGQKGQYLRQGENGLEFGTAAAVDGTASEEYVNQKVQEEATLRQNAIEDAKNLENATGVLAVAKGGTGATTSKEAQYNLLNNMNDLSGAGQANFVDDTPIICMYANNGNKTIGSVYKRNTSYLWEYIKGKISSVLGLTASNYNGTANKAQCDKKGRDIADTFDIYTSKKLTIIARNSLANCYGLVAKFSSSSTPIRIVGYTGGWGGKPTDRIIFDFVCGRKSADDSNFTALSGTVNKKTTNYPNIYLKMDSDYVYIYVGFTTAYYNAYFTIEGLDVINLVEPKNKRYFYFGDHSGADSYISKPSYQVSLYDEIENGNIIVLEDFATKSIATTDANGLMSSADKSKLEGIEAGANKTTVDSSLDSSSTNPVQNKVVNSALSNKVDKVSGKGLSTNDYTTAEKNKLAELQNNTVAQETIYGVVKARTISTYDMEMPEKDYLTDDIEIDTSNVEKFLKMNVKSDTIQITNKVGCPIKLYITEFYSNSVLYSTNSNPIFLLPNKTNFTFHLSSQTDSFCIFTEKLTVVNV